MKKKRQSSMTEIQKEEFRVAARERKRLFEKKELKKKFTFFRKSFFCFKQNQEQNMQNFKLFQSKRMLEKFMRSTRSQYRLWQITSIHCRFKQRTLQIYYAIPK